MRHLNQRRIFVELCDTALKYDASNKISLDVAFPSNKIGCIKCDDLNSTFKLGLTYFYILLCIIMHLLLFLSPDCCIFYRTIISLI